MTHAGAFEAFSLKLGSPGDAVTSLDRTLHVTQNVVTMKIRLMSTGISIVNSTKDPVKLKVKFDAYLENLSSTLAVLKKDLASIDKRPISMMIRTIKAGCNSEPVKKAAEQLYAKVSAKGVYGKSVIKTEDAVQTVMSRLNDASDKYKNVDTTLCIAQCKALAIIRKELGNTGKDHVAYKKLVADVVSGLSFVNA